MDKEKVLRLLTDLDHTGSIAEVHFDMRELEERAEAIAQAHDEETAELQTQVKWSADIARAQEQELVDLRAQMALMADCLKWLWHHHDAGHGCWHDDAEDYTEPRNNQVLGAIPKLLSTAPKVLFSRKAELHNGMLCGYLRGDPIERIDAPNQSVQLIVLAHEQAQGSEQPDAQGQ